LFLRELNLQNFRSFKKKSFVFSDKNNLIIGPNAAGKTNILEAIYLLATGKSFRAKQEKEMISDLEEISRLGGELWPKVETLAIVLTRGEVQGKRTARKLYEINGVGKRWRDFAGQLKCVLFRPEDIDLILGSPSVRRDYLDSVLEQTDWQYRVCHLAYKKGLRQRNKLLDKIREGQAKRSQLIFWNQLLIKNGQRVTQKREALIEFFNHYFQRNQKEQGSLELIYDRSVITEKRLEQYGQAELALGKTLVGPHRDDVVILKKKRNLALFGSRGEQRMAVLSLKLAEWAFITEKNQLKPILLLDDIFSELDKKHRRLIAKIIDSCQVIMTTSEPALIEKKTGIKSISLVG
jgi:DNA replication and repair protein RecF